jgi:hypothetical protein
MAAPAGEELSRCLHPFCREATAKQQQCCWTANSRDGQDNYCGPARCSLVRLGPEPAKAAAYRCRMAYLSKLARCLFTKLGWNLIVLH